MAAIGHREWVDSGSDDGTPIESRRKFARGLLAAKPAVPPGSAYLYSNAGYMLAAVIAEEATGRSWEELLFAEVF